MDDEATGQADGAATAPEGIAAAAVEGWFAEHAPGTVGPLEFERIAGGHSNLTYRVEDQAGNRWALRRPPLGKRLGSAHDMGREHKVVSALGPTEVPVAPVVGHCEDESVNGAPFYVMEFVEGPILRGLAEAEIFPDEDDRRAIGERVADTLVAIHAVDPDAVGLGDLGRKEDYVARQLRRWQGQWEKSKTRELPAIDRVHERLAARIPDQGPATIVHGDYRLDNMILTPTGEVAAVVDWELCTLGDPLADVGLLMCYWPKPGEEFRSPTRQRGPGFPTREEIGDRYAERSGRDLSQLDSTSPSATGSWRSSSRASTPATRPADTARSTPASKPSPSWSNGWRRRPRKPSSAGQFSSPRLFQRRSSVPGTAGRSGPSGIPRASARFHPHPR